jgi:hypothetical protein
MNTFTRLHKDNTIQSGDGQRQAGKATRKRKEKKRKQRRVDELITAKDFRLASFFLYVDNDDRQSIGVYKEEKKNYC